MVCPTDTPSTWKVFVKCGVCQSPNHHWCQCARLDPRQRHSNGARTMKKREQGKGARVTICWEGSGSCPLKAVCAYHSTLHISDTGEGALWRGPKCLLFSSWRYDFVLSPLWYIPIQADPGNGLCQQKVLAEYINNIYPKKTTRHTYISGLTPPMKGKTVKRY